MTAGVKISRLSAILLSVIKYKRENKMENYIELSSWPEGFEKACELLDFLPDDIEIKKNYIKAMVAGVTF